METPRCELSEDEVLSKFCNTIARTITIRNKVGIGRNVDYSLGLVGFYTNSQLLRMLTSELAITIACVDLRFICSFAKRC
jgi:hypothetical protein